MLKNGYGQLLHDSVRNMVKTESLLYILTFEGKVFSINYLNSSYEFVELKSNEFFIQISAGDDFILLLNDKGMLYGYRELKSRLIFALDQIEIEKQKILEKKNFNVDFKFTD